MSIESKLASMVSERCDETGETPAQVEASVRESERTEDSSFGRTVWDAWVAGDVTDAPWDIVADWLWCIASVRGIR